MKSILLVCGIGLLVGCASQPAPYLDAQGYNRFAAGTVAFNRCTEAGLMDPAVTALGRRYWSAELGKFNYYPDLLNAEVARVSVTEPTVPAAVCNQLAAAVMAEKQRIDTHNSAVQRSEQALQNTLNNMNTSRPVYCNTVGGVTMCN